VKAAQHSKVVSSESHRTQLLQKSSVAENGVSESSVAENTGDVIAPNRYGFWKPGPFSGLAARDWVRAEHEYGSESPQSCNRF